MTEQTSITLSDGELALDDGVLERRDVRGWPVWRCAATDEGDRFISLSLDGDKIRAVSWRGVEHVFALGSGAVVSTTLVK